jgi:hypothetical protein
MAKQKSMMEYMRERNSMQLKGSDDEIKGKELKATPIKKDLPESSLDEAKRLRESYKAGQESGDDFVKSSTSTYGELADLKEKEFQRVLKNERGENQRYKEREAKLGGKNKVTKKIERKEKLNKFGKKVMKNLDSIGAGAAIVGGGLYATLVAGKPKRNP